MKNLYFVEGKSDIALLKTLGCQYLYKTDGYSVVSRETSIFIARAVATRPAVLLLDPDGPGRRIKDFLVKEIESLDNCGYHVLEVEKKRARKRGKIGVAETDQGYLEELLKPYLRTDEMSQETELTKEVLEEFDLLGAGSKRRRLILRRRFGVPIQTARSLLDGLNILAVTRGEIEAALDGC